MYGPHRGPFRDLAECFSHRPMSRSKSILSLTIVLVLAAGVVVGRLWARLPTNVPVAPATTEPVRLPVSPAEALHLTPEQRKQMDEIWNDVRAKIGKTFDDTRNAAKQRDQKIQELLTPQQWEE